MRHEWLALEEALTALGLQVSPEKVGTLKRYHGQIVDGNRRVNLVSRRDVGRLVKYHFLDCGEGLTHLRSADRSVVDVGTGAGLPGIVWKILRPELEMVLVDSVRKRTVFLGGCVESLGLGGTEIVRSRAEDLAGVDRFRERFDVAVARTVARLGRLVEMSLPLLRRGGRLLAFKAADCRAELEDARGLLAGGAAHIVDVAAARSAGLQEKRTFVLVEKG